MSGSPEHLLDRLQALQEENRRLKALLDAHAIAWQPEPEAMEEPEQPYTTPPAPDTPRTNEEKIALFMERFHGRRDLYALRWESKNGSSGYAPACANTWRPGVCLKPAQKCSTCPNRQLLPLDKKTIHGHLAGRHTIGIYPLLQDDTCRFLATDFDGGHWQDDARAFMESCRRFAIPATLEISRSGNGAHIWIFFTAPVPARDARELGAALVSATCRSSRQLSLQSYDRFFPNQDTMPKGGFGNLIALPLQGKPRTEGKSVFANSEFTPYSDQWSHLAALDRLTPEELAEATRRVSEGNHPIDVAYALEEENPEPWKTPAHRPIALQGPLPASVTLVRANQLFIEKDKLGQPLTNRLIRLAAFQNPEFHKAQAMRLPVWNKPRIISCAETFPHHLALPRGCHEAVEELFRENGIEIELQDEREEGRPTGVTFTGELRKDQKKAMEAMLRHDTGILSAPTAFGKTVTAAAIIARRNTSTLVLVHRSELQKQWKERLQAFLDLPKGLPGLIGAGRNKQSGVIDIALLQTLARRENLPELLEGYGQVLVDECHHLSAFSFEKVLKAARARYVLGLTATPVRRDGHQPIIFMQCGPIRHQTRQSENAPSVLEVRPRELYTRAMPDSDGIQALFRCLVEDEERNRAIARDAIDSYREKRNILILTERTGHLDLLRELLEPSIPNLITLHGRMKKKERAETIERLASMDEQEAKIILATGRLIGEGFDYPPLDTLLLAMPISWKGTLQQYAGRLHRHHPDKGAIRIYDYIDQNHPQLARMWQKRRNGYLAMGYRIRKTGEGNALQMQL
ncbi:DEAD/DEAH box helicase [Chlorobium sp. N1]|uniref:TOTE conflict system archaeo-eukaryotic primase domain-containing protein n=1 Tax=Chlorobium sp. N1 TaxID=2491138 RepID=UPI00103E5129|nr:DEAD/DEAH box helicase [Chlorobium sp. N1]TCD46890.1 DEAD/DEAH box helicase [Chlorobium sp. N1]